MYAVFEDGSRQYRVSVGDRVKVDYREVEVGSRVEFGRVLLYAEGAEARVGQPTVAGMRVVGEVVDHPSTKVTIQYHRRRKNFKRLKGHRQPYTAVQVSHILLPGQDAPPPAPKKKASETPPASDQPGTGQGGAVAVVGRESAPAPEQQQPTT
jgi:large subunit ribosomal protein L21